MQLRAAALEHWPAEVAPPHVPVYSAQALLAGHQLLLPAVQAVAEQLATAELAPMFKTTFAVVIQGRGYVSARPLHDQPE